ncbi:MAG: hypothetical protein ING65_14750 [Rhodocyclaceae bacterium]|nr:hypothetical protein [Rhodocyclaceae bacterium]
MLTYTLPHVHESHPKGFKAEKVFCPKGHERPRNLEVPPSHPSACLAAAGRRSYQSEEEITKQTEAAEKEEELNKERKSEKKGPLSTAEVDALLKLVA